MTSQRSQARIILAIGAIVVLIALFFGVGSRLRIQEAESGWESHNTHVTAVAGALTDLNRQIGYGGFIHNFKNLVLRRDLPRYQKSIEANITDLRAQLDQLDALLKDEEDQAAITQIRRTFEEYISNYAKVQPLVAAGASSEELDALVKVNDGPAIKALADLNTRFILRAKEVKQLEQRTFAEAMRFAWISLGLVVAAIVAAVVALMMFLRRIVATNEIIRKAQAQLAEQEQLLRDVQRIAQLGGWKADLRSGHLSFTDEVYRIFGLSATEQVTVEWANNTFLPESRKRCELAINQLIVDGKPCDLELQIATVQGDRWIRVQAEVRRGGTDPGFVAGTVQDITERKQAEDALRDAHDIFDRSTAVAFLWKNEANWPVEYVSNNVTTLFGYTAEEFTSGRLAYASLIYPEDLSRVGEEVARASGEKDVTKFAHLPYRIIAKGGQVKWVSDDTVIRRDANGSITHYQGVLTDITESIEAKEQLRLAASVFGNTREGITITGKDGTILDVNEAFTRITGYSREDAIGQNPKILSSGRQGAEFYKKMWDDLTEQDHWSGEIWNRRKDGEVYAELLSISAISDGQGVTQQYVALFSDITAIKAHQSQLEHMAHFDALTNLPNRFLLADRLQQAMAQAQRRQQHLVVVYLDLDGFKAINDQYGHETGDQTLIVLAKRLKEALRDGDTMARIGGDEFVAVLADLEDTSASLPLLSRLQAAAARPVELGHLSLPLTASLGVTFYPQTQDIDGDQLLRQADQAMYQAKVAGKNRYHVFDAEQDSSIRKQHESLARIRQALERREFVLYYQPKVNMRTGKVIGAEALIRWHHPEDGLLAPATFLPAIEGHPLAIDVGEWVIDTAMRQMEVWHAAGLDLPVSVNIGAHQLLQDNFVERLQIILAKHPQVHPGCIELEVLETSALNDMAQASQAIDDCAGIGVKFALDDFGTGYSSLTYLKRLRVTQLKIDQSFVRDMLNDPDDLAILQGIIGLAAAFNREVIAEGVETVAHGTALLQLGCELAQGYGIARPMPPDQFPGWAATWKPAAAWSGVISSGDARRSTDM